MKNKKENNDNFVKEIKNLIENHKEITKMVECYDKYLNTASVEDDYELYNDMCWGQIGLIAAYIFEVYLDELKANDFEAYKNRLNKSERISETEAIAVHKIIRGLWLNINDENFYEFASWDFDGPFNFRGICVYKTESDGDVWLQPTYKDIVTDGVDIYDENGEMRDLDEIKDELNEIIYYQIIKQNEKD